MNYYEHHLGDYAQATAHLSFVEDAAYSRLLRKYYAEEQPLPADLRAVQRLVGARSEDEREAVEVVLKEFFTLEEDGWHNKRADAEIAKVHGKREKARRSAEARWNANASESNANASKDACGRNANASRAHNGRNALQSPVTSNQSPEEQEHPSPSAQDSSPSSSGTDLLGSNASTADLTVKRAERIATVTNDAIGAYNRILGKPAGLLAAVRATVGADTRREQVKRCLKTASEICQELYGDSRVTPSFWTAYFESAAEDGFHSGRGPYTGEHSNWRPDFEYLTRKKTMLKLFERAVDDGEAEAA
mgnify:CR=1 FL=1